MKRFLWGWEQATPQGDMVDFFHLLTTYGVIGGKFPPKQLLNKKMKSKALTIAGITTIFFASYIMTTKLVKIVDHRGTLQGIETNFTYPDRVQIIPRKIDLAAHEGDVFDIGFASFRSPRRLTFESADNGITIYGESDSFELMVYLAAPHPLVNATTVDSGYMTYVSRVIESEKTVRLPLTKVLSMSDNEFYSYLSELKKKGNGEFGQNGMYTFSTSKIKGIILLGQKPGDNSTAQVCVSGFSPGLDAEIGIVGSKDALSDLDPILSSFQFKIEQVSSKSQISNLVSKAGIKVREDEM